MKTGPRYLCPDDVPVARCQVRYSRLVHGSVRGRAREITNLEVYEGHQRKGYGSKLLLLLCAEATQSGVRLIVQVAPDGPAPLDDLARWYGKYGFREIQHDPRVMVR